MTVVELMYLIAVYSFAFGNAYHNYRRFIYGLHHLILAARESTIGRGILIVLHRFGHSIDFAAYQQLDKPELLAVWSILSGWGLCAPSQSKTVKCCNSDHFIIVLCLMTIFMFALIFLTEHVFLLVIIISLLSVVVVFPSYNKYAGTDKKKQKKILSKYKTAFSKKEYEGLIRLIELNPLNVVNFDEYLTARKKVNRYFTAMRAGCIANQYTPSYSLFAQLVPILLPEPRTDYNRKFVLLLLERLAWEDFPLEESAEVMLDAEALAALAEKINTLLCRGVSI
jgi:Tfp pilus assembly protein PilE